MSDSTHPAPPATPPDDHADFVALDEGAKAKMQDFVRSRGVALMPDGTLAEVTPPFDKVTFFPATARVAPRLGQHPPHLRGR